MLDTSNKWLSKFSVFLSFKFTLLLEFKKIRIYNLLLANYPINFSVKLKWFLDAIRAGVTEEIIFRLFFFAICVAVVKDKKMSKAENVLSYLIMTIPHVPFAVLQRKRDLTSAIVAHSVVDLIRFVLLGI